MDKKRAFKPHLIVEVEENSIAKELEIEVGDKLLAINNERIQDVFDYRFLLNDEEIEILIEKKNGEQWVLEIEKDFNEDLGLGFETELMDELIRCRNKCQFCFIDQLPPNMRQTVYLKDDDWRMSFLNGNYITLTNMSEYDFERLIKYRLSPINVSIHATDAEIRTQLVRNRFAGDIMEQLRRLVEAGIEVNGQIVLCKGINDGDVLERTIKDLSQFMPHILSLTVVPVGLSKYRKDLKELEGFDERGCKEVVSIIEKWQDYYLKHMGTRFVFAADEFYVTGKLPLPSYESYEDFYVLDNGVGMLRKFKTELEQALETYQGPFHKQDFIIATGLITEHFIKECTELVMEKIPEWHFKVYGITNHFFGENVTVTGLLTGQDLINQLKPIANEKALLLLAENMLKCGEQILLDDYTLENLEEALDMKIVIVPNEGGAWLKTMIQTKETHK